MASIPDHYDVLGVPPDATQGEIDAAYRRLALDRGLESADARERLEQIRAAYNVLADEQLRALYDIRREATLGMRPLDAPSPAEPVGVVRPKPWGIPAILAVLAIPFLLWLSGFILVIVEGSVDDLSEGETIANVVLGVLILDGIFIAGPWLFAQRRYRLGWSGLGLRAFSNTVWWWPFVAASTALVATIAYNAALYGLGARPEQDIDQLFDSRIVLPLTFFAVVIVAPLAEEIFFRGFVFAGLIRPLGAIGAMVASGILFAAFHAQDANSALLVPLFAGIGVGLAWIYFRTGSLWLSIGTHLIFNLVGFTMQAIASWSS